jgi:head-tail adaptor
MVVRARVGAIEFAGDEVRLAVVKTGGRLPRVLELHCRPAVYAAPEERTEALVAAVKSLVKDVKNRPAAFVLCVSSAHSVVRTLTIPFRGARKVAAAVRFELEPYLAFPIEDLAVDFSPVLEADGQTDVLAVGIRRAVLEEQLGILNAAGIDPEGVDVDAVGLTGLWRSARPNAKGLHAVLHVRDEGAVVAVVCNKTLAYFRHLSFGVASMLSNPGTVAREVLNSMRAFQAGWRGEGEIATLTVTGNAFSQDSSGEARAAFEKQFDIPVTDENLLEAVKAAKLAQSATTAAVGAISDESSSDIKTEPDSVSADSGLRSPVSNLQPTNAWEGVIGVALGAAGGGFGMNFRTGELASKDSLKRVAPHVMVFSCIALLALAGVAWYYYYARARNLAGAEDLRARIAELDEQVTALKGQGINLPAETFSDPPLLDILDEIAARMPDKKLAITELKIERSTSGENDATGSGRAPLPWITIRGEVKDDAVFGQVVEDLRQSTMFKIEEPDLKLEGGKSTFTLVAHRKGKGD